MGEVSLRADKCALLEVLHRPYHKTGQINIERIQVKLYAPVQSINEQIVAMRTCLAICLLLIFSSVVLGCSTRVSYVPEITPTSSARYSINTPVLINIRDIRKNQDDSTLVISAIQKGLSTYLKESVQFVDTAEIGAVNRASIQLNIGWLGAKFINVFLDKSIVDGQKVAAMISKSKSNASIIWRDVIPDFNPGNFDDAPPPLQGSYWMGTAELELTLYDYRLGRSEVVQIPIAAQSSRTNWWGDASGTEAVKEAWNKAQNDLLATLAKIIARLSEPVSKAPIPKAADPGITEPAQNERVGQTKLPKKSAKPAGMSSGTGWATRSGLIVTNHHVVSGRSTFSVVLPDGRSFSAKVMVADSVNDLALLRLDDQQVVLPALPIADRHANIGASVFTLGYPHPDLLGMGAKLSSGLISSETGLVGDPRTYQISVPVQGGNSGSPLMNMSGEVVGVVTSTLSAMALFRWTGEMPQNVSYALKTSYLKALLENAESLPVYPLAQINSSNLETLAQSVRNSILLVLAN